MIKLNIDYTVVGKRIKEARKSMNRTQEHLSEFLSVSTVYVSRIERGSTKINLETLVKVCTFLNVSTEFILSGTICSSDNYLRNEITDMLKGCSPEKIRLIVSVIKPIVEFKEL